MDLGLPDPRLNTYKQRSTWLYAHSLMIITNQHSIYLFTVFEFFLATLPANQLVTSQDKFGKQNEKFRDCPWGLSFLSPEDSGTPRQHCTLHCVQNQTAGSWYRRHYCSHFESNQKGLLYSIDRTPQSRKIHVLLTLSSTATARNVPSDLKPLCNFHHLLVFLASSLWHQGWVTIRHRTS